MFYSPMIRDAISFAIQVHETDTKYYASTDGGIVTVGILLDTIEDCEPYGMVTKDILFSKAWSSNPLLPELKL